MSCALVYFYRQNLKTQPFIPRGSDIWKYMEVLPYAVQKTDNNCLLNKFLNSTELLLDIWKSHKMGCHSH